MVSDTIFLVLLATLAGLDALFGEAVGEGSANPYVRAGMRMTLADEKLDIDLTVVTRPGGTRDERFVSLGVFWQSGRFLG